ncbi:MAG TPA: hypothetical protein VG714_04700 [Acidobacteriaceae bacterium]|nr:hypothetical protein [Acidobacteriaceae bacterium]
MNPHHPAEAATPPCPHFGLCGGCRLQDLAYSTQLARKAARLRQLLAAFTLPELQLHPSPPLAYRNRIRLTLRTIDGRLRAGYLSRPATEPGAPFMEQSDMSGESSLRPQFVPITQCPIAAPLLWRAAEAFLALANNTPWLLSSQLAPDQLELFTDAGESKLLLTLFLRTAQKNPPARIAADFTALCESLRVQIPQLAGAGIALLPPAARSRRIEQPRPGPSWGSPGLSYTLEPRTPNLEPLTYWVPRGAFFQVNRFLLPELVTTVTSAPTGDTALAWDLYAGIGLFSRALFSRALAHNFAQVTAVEIAEPAATALAQTKLTNLRAVKATTLDFLRAELLQRERPSLVVLDPPRSGAGTEVCERLTRIAAPTLIYISCSPDALARDLAALSGYSVAELHLFDLFPQTTHIETVAVLTRSQ